VSHYRLVIESDLGVCAVGEPSYIEPDKVLTNKELAMRVRSFSIAAAIMGAAMLGVVATVSSAATDATSAPVNKQRVAVEGVYSVVTGKGTFKLIPLTPGPLKADSGTLLGSGVVKPKIIRNGQGVTVIAGSDSYAGKNGSFTMIERLEEVTVGGPLAGGARYRILTGTWTFVGGTGAYEDVTGQGAYASVTLPRYGNNGRFSAEGIVRGR
jgi:hypothetical protein